MLRALHLRDVPARPPADLPVRRPVVRDHRPGPQQGPLTRAAATGAVPADVELSVRVLADGGTIAVARHVVDGRTRHIEAVVR